MPSVWTFVLVVVGVMDSRFGIFGLVCGVDAGFAGTECRGEGGVDDEQAVAVAGAGVGADTCCGWLM
jgi:hypothetical protein